MTADFTPSRTPSLIDTSAITGQQMRIHPDDWRELIDAYRFCWPGNGPHTAWKGTQLVADIEASMLPRKAL